MPIPTGSIVIDRIARTQVVVVSDWGQSVLVTSLAALKPDASLLERAQWQVPRADLAGAAVHE